jgi:hypothetical protein
MVVGAQVVLHSMVTSEFNGCLGKIARWDEVTGRFMVALEDGRAKSIKPTNLRLFLTCPTGMRGLLVGESSQVA